jgi:hypothetical protein
VLASGRRERERERKRTRIRNGSLVDVNREALGRRHMNLWEMYLRDIGTLSLRLSLSLSVPLLCRDALITVLQPESDSRQPAQVS